MFIANETGISAVEYVLTAGGIAAIIFLSVTPTGGRLIHAVASALGFADN